MRKLSSTPTESTPILNTRNNINSRRVTEKKIAVTGMFIYILLAGITFFSLFYINKKMDNNNPDNITGDDYDRRQPPTQILLFFIYVIHPFFILTPLAWYLTYSDSNPCPAWKNTTIWPVLLFLMAYTQFINSQLLLIHVFDTNLQVSMYF